MKELNKTKASFISEAKKQMQSHLREPVWTDFEKIALTCRILFAKGHDSGLAGQITARYNNSSKFITQKFGTGFDEVDSTSLLIVDEELNVLHGDGMPNPANRFHSWIYRARADVQCIIHTHPIHIAALSMIGETLKIAQMDSCVLYNDVGYLDAWPGVPVGDDEGEIIAAALGEKRAVLLAHHGLVVAGQSIEEACVLAIQCERAARLQLLATAAGSIRHISPALGNEAHDWLLAKKRVEATFYYMARQFLATPNNLPVDIKNVLLKHASHPQDIDATTSKI